MTDVIDFHWWISGESLQPRAIWYTGYVITSSDSGGATTKHSSFTRNESRAPLLTSLSSSSSPSRDVKWPTRNGSQWSCKFVFWQISFPHGHETISVRRQDATRHVDLWGTSTGIEVWCERHARAGGSGGLALFTEVLTISWTWLPRNSTSSIRDSIRPIFKSVCSER